MSGIRMPADLPDGAKAVWKRLVRVLPNPLTPADVGAFGELCRLQAVVHELESKAPVDHRTVSVLRRDLLTWYRQFHLTPESRVKLPAQPRRDPGAFDA